MSVGKIVGIILILAGLVLGYFGVDKVVQSDASVEIAGLEINASNKSEKREGYIYLALAVVVFVGGVYTLNKK